MSDNPIQPSLPGSTVTIRIQIRRDVVLCLGENFDTIMRAAQAHMMDAISTVLTLFCRFECMPCMQAHLMTDFFPWINEEGYHYILEDFDYAIFMRECVNWAYGWTEERVKSPCTDHPGKAYIH